MVPTLSSEVELYTIPEDTEDTYMSKSLFDLAVSSPNATETSSGKVILKKIVNQFIKVIHLYYNYL